MSNKVILHLCADTGSDTKPYQDDPNYEVILVGKDIGVENYHVDRPIYGIIANPVCLEFSTARGGGKARNPEEGMLLVNECLRIITEAKKQFDGLKFWVIENPATGRLRDYLGAPKYVYQPWWYGSPWTKKTALWGEFNIPAPAYRRWEDVPKNEKLYVRKSSHNRLVKNPKPALAFMHKNAYWDIDEFIDLPAPETDMEFRSLCSQKFAQAFKEANQ